MMGLGARQENVPAFFHGDLVIVLQICRIFPRGFGHRPSDLSPKEQNVVTKPQSKSAGLRSVPEGRGLLLNPSHVLNTPCAKHCMHVSPFHSLGSCLSPQL